MKIHDVTLLGRDYRVIITDNRDYLYRFLGDSYDTLGQNPQGTSQQARHLVLKYIMSLLEIQNQQGDA